MSKRVRVFTTDGRDHFVNLANADSMSDVQQMLEQQEWWTVDNGKSLIRTSSIIRVLDATPRAAEADADAEVVERTLPDDPRDY